MTDLQDLIAEVKDAIRRAEALAPPPTERLRDVLEYYDLATRLAASVNKLKAEADGLKRGAKGLAIAKLEDEELDGAPVTIDGQRVVFSKYEFHAGNITDREAFEAWAREEDGEAYFEPEARVRGELVNALVKQRLDDKEPLPPGVALYSETRLSRTAK